MTEHSGPGPAGEQPAGADEEGFEIPVFDSVGSEPPGPARPEASTGPVGGSGDGFDAAAGLGGETGGDTGDDLGDLRSGGAQPAQTGSAPYRPVAGESGDWTRTDSVRDDPGTLGEEVRKLWEVVHNHFVDPVLRNYPEAAGHLTSAGLEVASAFRALVRGNEQRWTGKPPAERTDDAQSDWDGRIVIGEDGSDIDEDTADRPKD